MHIRSLESVDELRALGGLLDEYIDFVSSDLERASGVSFDRKELRAKTFRTLETFVPPKGRTYIAETDASQMGMVFLRQSGEGAMEIKRLYVRPAWRGRGTGRALVERVIAGARFERAKAIRLDTTRNLTAAIALYESLGFRFREPYHESDHYGDKVLGPHLVFMEKHLHD